MHCLVFMHLEDRNSHIFVFFFKYNYFLDVNIFTHEQHFKAEAVCQKYDSTPGGEKLL